MGKTTRELEVSFTGKNESFKRTIDQNIEKNESFLKSDRKVKQALTATTQTFLTVNNAQEALGQGIAQLSGAFKLGLGGMVAVSIGSVLKNAFEESAKGASDLYEEISKVFEANQGHRQLQTTAELTQEFVYQKKVLEDVNKELQKLKSPVERAKQDAMSLYGGESASEKEERLQRLGQQVQEESKRTQAAMVGIEHQRVEVAEKLAQGYVEEAKGMENAKKRARELVDAETAGGKALRDETEKRQNAEIAGEERIKQVKKDRETMGMVDATKGFGRDAELSALKEKHELLRKIIADSSQEERDKGLTKENNALERQIKMMEAQNAVLDAQSKAEDIKLNIEGSSLSETSKRYAITLDQLAAVEKEMEIMKGMPDELRKSTQEAHRLKNELHSQDRGLNQGKSTMDIHNRMARERYEQRQNEKFDKMRQRDGGLMDVHRDMNGDVVSGRNPITGQVENRQPKDAIDRYRQSGSLRDKMAESTKDFENRFKKKGYEGPTPEALAEAARKANDGPKKDATNGDIVAAVTNLQAILQQLINS